MVPARLQEPQRPSVLLMRHFAAFSPVKFSRTGKDEPFQFIINKAKVQSAVTITLQAEGDPSTFSMTLDVLRSTNDEGQNEMMKLVRYNIDTTTSGASGNDYGSISGST